MIDFQALSYKWNLWKRSLKFWWQRRTRGFGDNETWNMDTETCRYMLPRLRRFREISNGVPAELTEQRWDEILDDMIFAFEFYGSGYDPDETQWQRAERGLQLFAEYLPALWW